MSTIVHTYYPLWVSFIESALNLERIQERAQRNTVSSASPHGQVTRLRESGLVRASTPALEQEWIMLRRTHELDSRVQFKVVRGVCECLADGTPVLMADGTLNPWNWWVPLSTNSRLTHHGWSASSERTDRDHPLQTASRAAVKNPERHLMSYSLLL